ncbi:MAG: hypothetical protein WD847_10080 [Pirellulales bacterium]
MKAGDTFRFIIGDDHLWMIISDPGLDKSKVLLVNLTTWRADKEQTCLVNPGDHPSVQHNSCIYYRGSRVHSDAHLNSMLNLGRIVLQDPLADSLLARIREGAARSLLMRLEHGQILFDQGLVE